MSRYRRSDMDFDYSGPPQNQRWDASRFSRESQYRNAPVIEERPPYQSARRSSTAYYDDEQDYYDRDYYGPRDDHRERRFYEEDDYYDPRAGTGAMVPYRPDPPPRPAPPARPRLLRRQSSVDRIEFERRGARRHYDDYYPPPPPPPQEYRRSRREPRYYYDDARAEEDNYYGDNGFREYREREWTRSRSRTRNDSPSPDRRAPTAASHYSSHHSEFIEAAPPQEEHFEEHIVEEEKVVEKPYPRRGKTRMPKRLVHTKVLFELGYPFYEEDEKTILILKALGPENIDEVFAKSKEYFEAQSVTTTKMIEAPPPAPPSERTISVAAPPTVTTKPISEAPRSVREWDGFNARSPSPGSSISQTTRKSSRRSKSAAARRSSMHESVHDSVSESVRERKSRAASRASRRGSVHESVHESIHKSEHRSISRSRSPAPTARTGRSRRSRSHAASRRGSSASGTTIIERRKTVVEEGGPFVEQSNPIDIGPLSIVPSRASRRTDAEIQAEIDTLERERRDVRRDTEIVRYESRSRRDSDPLRLGVLRSSSPVGEVIVADRYSGDDVRVRKDKRARSRSRPPGPGLLKSMMYTVT